jgi:tRNA 2-thiouridine synthesizing protein A
MASLAETSRSGKDRARHLDVIGLKCPLPVLKMQAALARLRPGQLLEIAATDPLAAIDIPHAAASGGHRLIESSRDGAVLHFTIRKGDN